MERTFPPEQIRACENCGNDFTIVELPDGGFEATNPQHYVDADPRLPETEWVFVCANCRVAVGIGEPE